MQSSTPYLTLNWRLPYCNNDYNYFRWISLCYISDEFMRFGGELGAKLKLSYLVIMNISFVSSSIVDDKVGWSPTYLCALMLLFILFKRRKCNRILKQIKCYPDSEQERKQCSPQNKHVEINHSFLLSLVSQCSTVESWNFFSLLPACT